MKVWITKYALTIGIEEVEADWSEEYPNMIKYGGFNGYAHGNDWHRTFEAARNRAEQMRVAKIVSLEKSIAKLRNLKFAP